MTAIPSPTAYSQSRPPTLNRLGHFVWPAAATVILHATVFALLLGNWSPKPPTAASETVLKTQLVTINTAPTPEPTAAPVAEPPAPAVEPPPPPPPAPPLPEVAVAEPLEPQIDHAAIARKRAEENERRERARLAEQQRQKEARIAEQQRLEEKQRQEQQRLEALAAEQAHREARALAQAEQQRIAQAKKQAVADSLSQYHPISKQPPAYPKRALDRRKEGDCTVEYTVTAQGTVKDPVVVEGGCDDMIFARPALTSAKSFRYKPRLVNGVAVAVPGVRNTFRFRLEQ